MKLIRKIFSIIMETKKLRIENEKRNYIRGR